MKRTPFITRLVGVSSLLIGCASLNAADEPAAEDSGPGSCSYVQQNMFAGPFNVCETSLDSGACDTRGTTDENSDAKHVAGSCSTESVVGTCDLGETALIYYTGDPSGLEIGCGFQGGMWSTPDE